MISERTLRMAAILPHTKLFGGVKRFFELGKVFESHGHKFLIFTPEGLHPEWCVKPCAVEKLENLERYQLDALFITEVDFLQDLVSANTRLRIFYHVGPRAKLSAVLEHKDIVVFANSTTMYELDKRKYGIHAIKAFGGIHIPETSSHTVDHEGPFTVMAYGRLTRKGKGTSLVVKACEALYKKGYNIKLLLFDSPIDDLSKEKIAGFRCNVPFEFIVDHPVSENNALFSKADVFVAAEKKGGWSNTAAEALAAGVPLIGTSTGTKDFLIHNKTGLLVWRHSYFIRKAIEKLMKDPGLRRALAINGREKIREFNWQNLARFIETYVSSKLLSASFPEK